MNNPQAGTRRRHAHSQRGIGAARPRLVTIARKWLTFLLAFSLCAEPALAAYCAQPGKDGTPASLSGIVNTYFPATADVNAGGASISLGAARGASAGITAGDLLLIIQMQDAEFDASNNDGYGDNVNGGSASGYEDIHQTGDYEFVRATNSVGLAGGTVTIVGQNGGGLVNSYDEGTYASGRRQSFQVVRVPQYVTATLSGTVTAAAWDGRSGGIVAIDVAQRLTFAGGAISADGAGFRGGAGRDQDGPGTGSNTSYRTVATSAVNGAKGEGISGTPRYVFNGTAQVDTGVEGYANGSNGRGAPGNAGGGGTDGNTAGNDENTGGGGGGNGGGGGRGGHAWCGSPAGYNGCPTGGGHGGSAVSELGFDRLTMGGGGGAGTNNNATGSPAGGLASSGAAGGGIVIVRAAEIAGTGNVTADGADANNSVTNDGSGGGGAGGAILLSSIRSVAGTSISARAEGGNGGTNTGGGSPHGPGGGGGGGYIARTATVPISASVAGGNNGTTASGSSTYGIDYGSTDGTSGVTTTVSASSIPGVSSGGECTPTISKSFATSPITPGSPSVMSVSIVNNNPTLQMTNVAFTDTYPSGLVNTASASPAKSCATAGTVTGANNGSSFALSGGVINSAGASCTYTVNTTVTSSGDKINTIAAGGISWTYGSSNHGSLSAVSATISVAPPLTIVKSSQVYIDPQNGTTNPKAIPGSFIAYTVTVANPGSITVTNNSVIIVDATPANLWLFVGDVPGGSGPILFQNGSPSSGLTYTFSGLGSTTDDVEFSNNNGSTWTYTPVLNASMVDPNVTHMRIRPKGTMAANSSFSLIFGYMVQ